MNDGLRIFFCTLIGAGLGFVLLWFWQQSRPVGIEESLWRELKGLSVALHESQQREAKLREDWGRQKLANEGLRDQIEITKGTVGSIAFDRTNELMPYPWRKEEQGVSYPLLRSDESLLDALLLCGTLPWLKRWTELDGAWEQQDADGCTPLMKALALSPLEVVRWLWGRSDRQRKDDLGRSLLHHAVVGDLDVLKWLLQKDIDLNHLDEQGQSPIYHAVVAGRVDAVRALLDAKVDADRVDLAGCSPLHVVAKMGSLELVKMLPLNELRDDMGQSPLFKAVKSGHLEVSMALFKRFEQMLELDERGASLLHHAVRSGETDCVKWLIDKGHPLELQDFGGRTPLHLSAELGDHEILRALLRAGSSVLAFDALERTPLHIAVVFGHLEAVQCLRDWGADPALIDATGRSVEEWEKLLRSH
jgi:ankyrin repeat protein